jgi:hypothetical protein
MTLAQTLLIIQLLRGRSGQFDSFRELNRRPKIGFEFVAVKRQVSGFTANPLPSSGAGKSGEKNASFDLNRRRMSASIISHVTSIAYGASRG